LSIPKEELLLELSMLKVELMVELSWPSWPS
jgi:hypothetical protein